MRGKWNITYRVLLLIEASDTSAYGRKPVSSNMQSALLPIQADFPFNPNDEIHILFADE